MIIEEVMTRQVITVRPETSVQEAARLMSTNRVSGLPVVDASGQVVGIISDGDLILRQRRPKVRPWWRMPEIPYPDFGWLERVGASVPLLSWRTAEYFYFLTVVLVAASLWVLHRIVTSPFGRMLTTIRENAERAEFIGVNVRRYELAAFVLAGTFAGLAGGLFGIFNRGVFPDFAYWTKSSEVLIMGSSSICTPRAWPGFG